MLFYKYSILGIISVVLSVSSVSCQYTQISQASNSDECEEDYCSAYCDSNGNARDGFNCPRSGESNQWTFCCGDEHNRFCCSNDTLAINCQFAEQYMCYSWWIFNWQMALAMLGTVVLLLTVSACCCQCFAHKTNQRAFARAEANAERRRRRGNGDVSTIEMEETPTREQVFDPNSVHAFQPPDYAKDPPKYQDIDFAGPSGETNPAFTADEGINPAGGDILLPPPEDTSFVNSENNQEVAPPPPYTLYESAEDTEVNAALNASQSGSSSPRVIRVSSSPTIVDNRHAENPEGDSQTQDTGPL